MSNIFLHLEALVDSIDKIEDTQKHIPWQKIKDFRNIIAHDYFGIDADEIWEIINKKLFPFKKEILKLIDNKVD